LFWDIKNKSGRSSKTKSSRFYEVAEPTGLEPATSDVTGRRSNQLNYDSEENFEFSNLVGTEGLEPPTSSL
jgi:hypothetical protein